MSYRDPSLAGKELTPREREVLAAHDAGKTAQEIAEQFGYASANGAGNVVRVALTKSNRGGEIRSGGGRSRTPKVTGAEDLIRQGIEAADATITVLNERLHEAREGVSATPKQLVDAEVQRLTERVDRAVADRDAFQNLDKPARDKWVSEKREAAQTQLASLENELTEGLEKAQAEREKMVAMAEAAGITL